MQSQKLESELNSYLGRIQNLPNDVEQVKGRLAKDGYERYRGQRTGDGSFVNPEAMKKGDEDAVKRLPADLERARAAAIKSRVAIARLKAQIAELQKDANDTPAQITEATARDEAQLDVLTIEVEQARQQWQGDIEEVRQQQRRLLQGRPTIGDPRARTPEAKQHFEELDAEYRKQTELKIATYQEQAEASRARFLKLRTELAKLEARLQAAGRSALPRSQKLSSTVEQRLLRIEQALERLEKAK